MPPAARITDMHVCPMVTGIVPHVGGPILPPCQPTVLIGGLPAARITDMLTCVGPPDVILMGSPTVLIGNLLAARIGDPTAHGGVIVLGCFTVIIGEAGAPSPSAPGGPMLADATLADAGDGSAATPSTPAPKWTEAEIKAEWKKTEAGTAILKNLPASTQFKSYVRPPGDNRNAYYSPKENTIYIPSDYTSVQAAPTAGHEAVHADQVVNHKRPKDPNDKIEMEVEAKNAGLDVYDQMGKPDTPYNYKAESKFRSSDPDGYNKAVRDQYKKHYGIR